MDKTLVFRETLAMLRKELAELRDREKQIEAAIDVINRLVPQEELFSFQHVAGLTATMRPARDGLVGMTMIEAAEAVLRDAGRPMHVMEIVEKMLEQGFRYDKSKKALRASLTGSMERKEDIFQREAPATYGLRIWTKSNSENETGVSQRPEEWDDPQGAEE